MFNSKKLLIFVCIVAFFLGLFLTILHIEKMKVSEIAAWKHSMNKLLKQHKGTIYGFNHRFDEFITYRPGILKVHKYPSSEVRCELTSRKRSFGIHMFSPNSKYLAVGFYSTKSNWKLEFSSNLFDVENCREVTDFVGQLYGQQIFSENIGKFSPDSKKYHVRGLIYKDNQLLKIANVIFDLTTS